MSQMHVANVANSPRTFLFTFDYSLEMQCAKIGAGGFLKQCGAPVAFPAQNCSCVSQIMWGVAIQLQEIRLL